MALSLISQFNPTEGGQIHSIGFDPIAGKIYVHFSFNANVHIYNRSGTFQGTIPDPGAQGNDGDMDFADEAIDVNGTNVPDNSLLVIQNEVDPPQIIGANKTTGAAIATRDFSGAAVGQWVGGACHHNRNTCYIADVTADDIQEVRASDGTILNSFDVAPALSPAFEIFFGDLDVLKATGNLHVVSSSQNNIRELSPTGAFIQDTAVGGLPVTGMSGIAFDDLRGEAWISSINGNVYQLGGFQAIPLPSAAVCALALPFLAGRGMSRTMRRVA